MQISCGPGPCAIIGHNMPHLRHKYCPMGYLTAPYGAIPKVFWGFWSAVNSTFCFWRKLKVLFKGALEALEVFWDALKHSRNLHLLQEWGRQCHSECSSAASTGPTDMVPETFAPPGQKEACVGLSSPGVGIMTWHECLQKTFNPTHTNLSANIKKIKTRNRSRPYFCHKFNILWMTINKCLGQNNV